jgi:AcrR family transcriptional regulator
MARPTRKPEILPAAAKLAERHGLAAVNHRLIGVELNMGMTAMFNHYPTGRGLRNALIEYALEHPRTAPRAHIEAQLATLKGQELNDFVDQVIALLEAMGA